MLLPIFLGSVMAPPTIDVSNMAARLRTLPDAPSDLSRPADSFALRAAPRAPQSLARLSLYEGGPSSPSPWPSTSPSAPVMEEQDLLGGVGGRPLRRGRRVTED